MTKRSLQQIEESLRARLAEAGSNDLDNNGVPDEIQQRSAPGLNPYDPLNIGGKGAGFNIDIGIGGTGRGGTGGARVWRTPGKEKSQAVPTPLKPKVSIEKGRELGVIKPEPKVWRRGEIPATDKTPVSPQSQTPQEKLIAQAQQRAKETGEPTIAVTDPRLSKFLDKMFPQKSAPDLQKPGPGPKFTPGEKIDTGLTRLPGPGTREIWHSKPSNKELPSKEQLAKQSEKLEKRKERGSKAGSAAVHAAALAALLAAQQKKEKESGGAEPTGTTAGSDSVPPEAQMPATDKSGPDMIELPKVDLPPGRYGAGPGYEPSAGSMGGSIIVEPKRKEADAELKSLPPVTVTAKPDLAPIDKKIEPRVEPRAEPKIEPRAEPRAEPKIEPRVEPKIEPRVEPRVTQAKPGPGATEVPGAGPTNREGPGTKTSPGGTGEKPGERPGPSTGNGTEIRKEPTYRDRGTMTQLPEHSYFVSALQTKLHENYQSFKSQTLSERVDLDPQQLEQLRQDPNVRRMLDLISRAEGADYDTIVGQLGPKAKKIIDYSKHPRYVGLRTKHGPSDAAGRYQILSSTYRGQAKKLGITDFSPESQDKIAISILNDVGALEPALKGDFKKAILRSNNQWVSLPGTKYEQGHGPRSWKWVTNTLQDLGAPDTAIASAGVDPTATSSKTTEPKKEDTDPGYYAVGDSHGTGIAGYGGKQWTNLARAGASVVDPKQFKQHLANIEKIPAGSVVAISLGANDISRAKPQQIVDQLNKLITAAQARGHQVIHLLPTSTTDSAAQKAREQLRQVMLQGQTQAPIVDLGAASKKDPMGLHLDPKGYKIIAKNISDMLIPSAVASELPKDSVKPVTGKPVGSQVQPDWSKYKYGDHGVLVKNEKGEWKTADGKKTAADPDLIADLEKSQPYTAPESFLDKVKRTLPPGLGGKGELVSQVFGDKKKQSASTPTVEPRVEPKVKAPVVEPQEEPKVEPKVKAPVVEPKIDLQKDQAGLTKAKKELSDFKKAFAAARDEKGSAGTFRWTDPKTGRTGTYSTSYKNEPVTKKSAQNIPAADKEETGTAPKIVEPVDTTSKTTRDLFRAGEAPMIGLPPKPDVDSTEKTNAEIADLIKNAGIDNSVKGPSAIPDNTFNDNKLDQQAALDAGEEIINIDDVKINTGKDDQTSPGNTINTSINTQSDKDLSEILRLAGRK